MPLDVAQELTALRNLTIGEPKWRKLSYTDV